MPTIAIVTDTDSSLPPDLAEQHGILLVPITINFGDESFQTGIDIDDAALFARVDREGQLPSTAAPTPGAFAKAFTDAMERGADAIVCLCVSSEISATYTAALTARDLMPDCNITIIDSQTVSMTQGFMAIAAAEAAARSASVEEVIDAAHEIGQRTVLYGALSTVKYVAMSGRIGHLAAGMATLLNIRPILAPRAGRLEMIEKVRTRKRSWERMVELLRRDVSGRPVERAALLHVNAEEDAREFYGLLCGSIDCPPDPSISPISAGLSVHTGAGLVGAALVVGR
ncbi:MAG: DegV family protein [Chloroflexi bacterium]|nr:DegV family protein [Chloroflexota bacterium]